MPDSIKAILKFEEKIDLWEKADRAHYSSVLESGIEPLIEYIEDNLASYVDNVLNSLNTSKEENETTLIRLINSDSLPDEPKKKYLLNQSGWIRDLEAIDAGLWDLAFDSLIVYPTWGNVMKYYSKHAVEKPSEPVVGRGFKDYLSDKTVFSILTDDKVFGMSDNTTDITSLFNEISSDKSLSDECYTSLLKSFDSEELPTDFSLSGFSQAKINFLIEFGIIPYNSHFVEQIKSYATELMPDYLIKHKDEYLSNFDVISLNSSQYQRLLSSNVFSDSEKIGIIESIGITELNKDAKLATLMCSIILRGPTGIDDEILNEIIALCESENIKTEVVLKHLRSTDYDEDTVTEYLNMLGEDYQKLTGKGKKPSISIDSSRGLLDYLRDKGYLKNLIHHDNYIRVINRT